MTSSLRVAFAVPGDLASPTGGYAYARALLAEWPALGVEAQLVRLPGGFPFPSEAELDETEHLLAEIAPDRVVLIDGLAYGAFPADLAAGIRAPIVALVHHPLALESGLAEDRRTLLAASERMALAVAKRAVATSRTTARTLIASYAVPAEKIAVAEPGTPEAPRAQGTGHPVALIAIGAVSERKGYAFLVKALAPLRGLDWRLTIAGSVTRDPAAAQRLEDAIGASGLEERVTLAGAVSDEALAEIFDRADILVSSSLYEGYGMVLAEGLARGLPLVASTGGAAAETMPDGAGLKVAPGDSAGLREALRRMIGDEAFRRACADAAWAEGQRLPRWRDTAARVGDAMRGLT